VERALVSQTGAVLLEQHLAAFDHPDPLRPAAPPDQDDAEGDRDGFEHAGAARCHDVVRSLQGWRVLLSSCRQS